MSNELVVTSADPASIPTIAENARGNIQNIGNTYVYVAQQQAKPKATDPAFVLRPLEHWGLVGVKDEEIWVWSDSPTNLILNK